MSLLEQIRQAKAELDHLGSCTQAGKTPEQLAEMDNKFYAALDKKAQLERQLYDANARRFGRPTMHELEVLARFSNHKF